VDERTSALYDTSNYPARTPHRTDQFVAVEVSGAEVTAAAAPSDWPENHNFA
jgi:hypothetical protein